ncbi:class I SAM-dependent methyltransferase [Pontibacter qinzhouensis]|uniref:class I SAM-dependent methyltransferase n=1 Tax=Pontibacter qinzhouensis TaxID=2603253 RepID=UPI00210332FC|nr:class I SAM-dependent methyltransferase [Pontibacter qinzhouensis]
MPDRGFDRIAPFYDVLAGLVFGNELQQAQNALLPFVQAKQRVLIIGGGSGKLLEQMLRTCQPLQVLYLEASPVMLRLAQQRFAKLEAAGATVEFRLGTEAALQETELFDTIITPFLLDLFPPHRLQGLMSRLARSLDQNGQWLFTDFWPVATPAPWWQQVLLKSMYIFFGIVSQVEARSLPDFKNHFEQLQLQEVYTKPFLKGLVQTKVFRKTPPQHQVTLGAKNSRTAPEGHFD